MKNNDLMNLEEAYSSIHNNKIVEEMSPPDTSMGDALLLGLTALLPIIFERVLSLIPVLKNQTQIIVKLKEELQKFITNPQGTQLVKDTIKSITKKQTLDGQSDKKIEQKSGFANELTGGIRKTPSGFKV